MKKFMKSLIAFISVFACFIAHVPLEVHACDFDDDFEFEEFDDDIEIEEFDLDDIDDDDDEDNIEFENDDDDDDIDDIDDDDDKKNDDKKDNNGDGKSSLDNTTGKKTDKDPKTGLLTSIGMWSFITAVSGGSFFLFSKKRKK